MAERSRRSVLFLCTGNYYRSRYAEIIFNSVAGTMGLAWQADSRGLKIDPASGNVGPMSRTAVQLLSEKGLRSLPAMARMPQPLHLDDLARADRVVALKRTEHEPMLQASFADHLHRVEFWEIDDLPGVLPKVEQEVMGFIARLLGGGGPVPEPSPAPVVAVPKKKPLAKVGRETAGRRGKGVTTVFDLKLSETELLELAATLKNRCGTGGTVKDGRIEIQGDQRERIVAELERLGFQVKRAGG